MGNIPIYSAEKRPSRTKLHHACAIAALAGGIAITGLFASPDHVQAQAKRPNIVMLMTDDTGWNDFGAYSNGGKALGHPTPNVDQIAEEGATFTELVRTGELHGRPRLVHHRAHSDPLGAVDRRRAGDQNMLRKETPTIAEFFKKNGYSTYFSGKWHLGDKPEVLSDRARLRRDEELRRLLCRRLHLRLHQQVVPSLVPVVQSCNSQKYFSENVNLNEWEGVAGQPAKDLGKITYDRFATFDEDQADNAVDYIKQHANDDKPFFMDVNYLKMHNPTNAGAGTSPASRISAIIRTR